jgi:hypothetical protein
MRSIAECRIAASEPLSRESDRRLESPSCGGQSCGGQSCGMVSQRRSGDAERQVEIEERKQWVEECLYSRAANSERRGR